MGERRLHEVFVRLPKLDALHRRLLKASLEQPGMVLIASSPFLVYPEGSLCRQPLENPWFIFADDVEDESVLYSELELIAHGIEEGRYSKRDLRYLEKSAKRIRKIIGSLSFAADAFHTDNYPLH